jgi:hypothetical protein
MTKNNDSQLAVISNNIEYIKQDICEIRARLEKDYVTRQEFDPIKKIVYGLVTLILTGVVVALIKLVLIP